MKQKLSASLVFAHVKAVHKHVDEIYPRSTFSFFPFLRRSIFSQFFLVLPFVFKYYVDGFLQFLPSLCLFPYYFLPLETPVTPPVEKGETGLSALSSEVYVLQFISSFLFEFICFFSLERKFPLVCVAVQRQHVHNTMV